MASVGGGEEGDSLLTVDESSTGAAATGSRENHARDVHLLCVAFLLIFLAYSAAQNLESSVNSENDLGTTSMGILYLSLTLFSLVASPIVKKIGSKNALLLGTTGYLIFIASNLIPKWYTMFPASVYLGFSASIIWVGQGTYLTSAARSHANDSHLHEGTVIGHFNGEFWAMFASTQVVGNLLSFILLKNKTEDEHVSRTTLLFMVFLGSMALGTILMCFLHKRDTKKEEVSDDSRCHFSCSGIANSIVAPLLNQRMLLLIPLLAYSGLQQAFIWDEFTKYIVTPALGISGVGGAMALFGACDAICSLVSGRLTSSLISITVIISLGSFFQICVLFWMLFKYSLVAGASRTLYPLLMAALWGIGDGVYNTQINALLGMLFKHDMEAAFAQLKVWQSASTAIVFFLSSYISFHAMLTLIAAAMCVALGGLTVLTFKVEKAFIGT
ncbi:UNC93-like protein 3 [Nymphaea colorata]|nr:UNC93-like protein 3 [Nymphaea colorata]